jgi:predicted Ser/Thr protein kinase
VIHFLHNAGKLFAESIILRSSYPKLRIHAELGRGSTGHVFAAQWNGLHVVVKISYDTEARRRLQQEAAHYCSLATQTLIPKEQMYQVFPEFLGWYHGEIFDVMISTAGGHSLGDRTWDMLSRDQRWAFLS